MQQNQDIKGFTLLELLVVISLVAIISAVAYPNFSSWKKEREVRGATEKIAGMISNVATQTQRGNFSYSQFWVLPIQGQSTVFFTKGMKKNNFTSIINSGATPTCRRVQSGHWDTLHTTTKNIGGTIYGDYYEVYDPESGIGSIEIATHLKLDSAVCFGTNGSYYKVVNGLSKGSNTNINLEGVPTANYIIICTLDNAKKFGQKCPRKLGLEKPAYLVKWSRFGNVTKYKWSGSDWNRQ